MPTRRSVIKGAAAAGGAASIAALSPAAYGRIIGANDRVRVAAVGVRSRGMILIKDFTSAGADVTQVYDTDSRVEQAVRTELDEAKIAQPTFGKDFRRALDDPSIDVVAIATPDHWHACGTLMALAAGKHVYVEKPCSHNPHEGKLVSAAQAKTGLHVQMGNQQRSSQGSIELIDRVRSGDLGDIYHVHTWYANRRGSIGKAANAQVPDWLDWDLWQGPAPRRDYADPWVHYDWHWNWHWGTGETCNNALHELDIARWIINAQNPEKVRTRASRRFYTDDAWQMYDTMNAEFTYPGDVSITWDGHSRNNVQQYGRGRGAVAFGTKGSAIVDRGGYEMYDLAGKLIGESKTGGGNADTTDLRGGGNLTTQHCRNLLEVIQGRASTLVSPIDEGATSTLMCHLANIAYRTGAELTVDPQTGRIAEECAQAYWSRDYEPGWMPTI